MNTAARIDKWPFELRVLATKGSPGSADTTRKEPSSDQAYRVPCLAPEFIGPESGSTGSAQKVESLETILGSKGDGFVRIMQKHLRRVLLASLGQVGAAAASVATLWSALTIQGYSGRWIYEAVIGLLLLRLLYHLTRGPIPTLARYRIRKRLWWVVSDEVQISVAFAAACFMMSWPVGYDGVIVFFLANLAVQGAVLLYSQRVIKTLSQEAHSADPACFARRAVILGTGVHAQRVADMVISSPELDTKLSGFLDYRKEGLWRYRDIPLLGHPSHLEEIVHNSQVDAVFVAVEPEDIPESRGLFDIAERMGVCVFVMPNVYYPNVSRIRPSYVNGMPALIYRSAPESRAALFAKAVVDRVGAVIGLVLAAPLMLMTAILIKLESRGPIIFKQVRAGINGKTFNLYKFRTMCVDAEEKQAELSDKNEMSGPVFKISKDPRVTTMGRWLRKFSIDELPQFVNILKGDMSLVGPRPPLPKEVSNYKPWQHRKLSVKPGVTCLWQVNGRNAIEFEDWMQLDLEYIDTWSLWLDTKILLKTVPTVLRGTGV